MRSLLHRYIAPGSLVNPARQRQQAMGDGRVVKRVSLHRGPRGDPPVFSVPAPSPERMRAFQGVKNIFGTSMRRSDKFVNNAQTRRASFPCRLTTPSCCPCVYAFLRLSPLVRVASVVQMLGMNTQAIGFVFGESPPPPPTFAWCSGKAQRAALGAAALSGRSCNNTAMARTCGVLRVAFSVFALSVQSSGFTFTRAFGDMCRVLDRIIEHESAAEVLSLVAEQA